MVYMPNNPAAVKETKKVKDSHFSPISELFKQSWDLMASGALNALFISLISGVSYFVAAILSFVVLAAITASTVNLGELFTNLKDQGPAAFSQVPPAAWTGLGIGGVMITILFALIGAAYTGAMIYAFAWAEK